MGVLSLWQGEKGNHRFSVDLPQNSELHVNSSATEPESTAKTWEYFHQGRAWKKSWFGRKALHFLEVRIYRPTSTAIEWKYLWFVKLIGKPWICRKIFKPILEIMYTLYLALDCTKYRSKSLPQIQTFKPISTLKT